jgi:glycosyltransferase involved in cell wall biosynthesis
VSKPTVSFLTYDWTFGVKPLQPNGCAWYRCYLPMKELANNGWESGIGIPGFNPDHGFGILIPDQKAIHGWEIVVLKLIMLERVVDQVRQAKELGQKIVVDIDDHMEGLEETNLAYKTTSPEANPKNNREHYVAIMDQADALITSTPFLQEWYQNKYPNKPVYLIRNGIDIDRWGIRNDHKGWLPVFGWVGATPWRSGDLEILKPYFGQFIEKRHLKFHHAGSIKNAPKAYDQAGINKIFCTEEPMKTMLGVPELYSRKIDVGIVPLRDVPFNHAKSYLKGMEYAAAGVPFIATGLPEYQLLADAGVGRVANTPQEWMGHMEELLDPKVRKEEREKGFEILKEKFSMKQRGLEWANVLEEIRML